MKANRELVKALILVAPSVEKADKLIVENFGFETTSEKIAFLRGMYDEQVFAEESSTGRKGENDYYAMLSSIMNS